MQLAGHDVTLIHHDPAVVRAINKDGVMLREIDGKLTRVRVPVRRGPATIHETEVLIVAVKAYDTRVVARSYRGKIPFETIVLSLQNGLGNVETLQSTLNNQILGGSTSEGASSSGPGQVARTGRGLTLVGDTRGRSSKICGRIKTAFDRAGIRAKTSSNIRGVIWTKAIINASINPISSLVRMSNGALAKNAAVEEIAREVIREGIAVCRAARIGLVGDPTKLWRKILLSTKANKSSMLQDIERGRMTEIRQLNGAIISEGKKRGVDTPVNDILTRLLLGLEESSNTMLPPA